MVGVMNQPGRGPQPEAKIEVAPGASASEVPGETARVDAQCFLIDNWRSYCPPTGMRANGYGGNFTCVDGPASDLLQRLTSDSDETPTSAFLKMTPAQFALLVPMIRLFKASMDPNTKALTGGQQEVKFKTFLDKRSIQDITRTGRSDMVGLKELSYELHQGGGGTTTGRRQKITIKFVAESINALSKRDPDSKVSVLDLVLHPKVLAATANDQGKIVPGGALSNQGFYAVKVVYGWAVPNAREHLFSQKLRDAIKYSATTLILTLTSHNLSFREDGSVEVEAEYEGYADAKIGEAARNVLRADEASTKRSSPSAIERSKTSVSSSGEQLASRRDALREAIADEARADAADTNLVLDSDELNAAQALVKSIKGQIEAQEEAIAASEKDVAVLVSADRQNKYSQLLKEVGTRGKIYHIDIDPTLITEMKSRELKSAQQVAKMGPDERKRYEDTKKRWGKARGSAPAAMHFPDGDVKGKAILMGGAQAIAEHGSRADYSATADVATYHKSNKPETVDGGLLRINFMYWGDIFNTVLKMAYTGTTIPVKYLVGQLVFQDQITGETQNINIADIPISLHLFSSWWIKKVIAPGRDTYTIKNFIRDSVNELIVAALGDACFKGAPAYGPLGGASGRDNLEPPRFEFTVISAALGQGQKDRIRAADGGGRIKDFDREVEKVVKATDATKPQNQVEYLYLYCNAWSRRKLSANAEKDKKAGIHHISIGQDAGPIKKITFEKDSDIDLSTQAAMNSSGVAQLVASYKANISMIGNTLFKPGNYIYIAPTAMGISEAAAHAMGLGGYYTIANINGKVDSTGWSSELKCIPLFNSYHTRKSKHTNNPAADSISVDPATAGADGGPSAAGADPEAKQS
jgi:hypothetical protein